MSQSSTAPTGGDAAALRAQFAAEVLAADIAPPPGDLEQLFVMWSEHRSARLRLRAADIALEEEPSFTQKPAQAGAGVTLPGGATGGQ